MAIILTGPLFLHALMVILGLILLSGLMVSSLKPMDNNEFLGSSPVKEKFKN